MVRTWKKFTHTELTNKKHEYTLILIILATGIIAGGLFCVQKLNFDFFQKTGWSKQSKYYKSSPLWWSHLSEERRKELDAWYEAWLVATETKIIPEKPSWLN